MKKRGRRRARKWRPGPGARKICIHKYICIYIYIYIYIYIQRDNHDRSPRKRSQLDSKGVDIVKATESFPIADFQ